MNEPVCYHCGTEGTTDNPVTLGPDPYAYEINNDETEVWECASCRQDSCDDI
jgi:hypothetical protein